MVLNYSDIAKALIAIHEKDLKLNSEYKNTTIQDIPMSTMLYLLSNGYRYNDKEEKVSATIEFE